MSSQGHDDPSKCVADGNALRLQGDAAGAVRCYLTALTVDPNHAEACNNLGVIYILSGRLEEAISLLQRAIVSRPNWSQAWNNLGNAFMQAGQVVEAIAACRRALEIDPAFELAQRNLAFFPTFDTTRDARTIFAKHCRWAQANANPLRNNVPPHTNDRTPNRRLRIGYVSPDFREHAVAYFMEGLLANHDPREFEVHCYADVPRPDHVTACLRGYVHGWHSISGIPDNEVAAIIRSHQIDILIDLAGYTNGGRPLIFARKPAPVQVSYLGYPNTTGMSAIDYRLVDAYTDPPGMTEELWTEQLIRLPRTFASYRPPMNAPPVGPLPALSKGFITFGSFAMLSKLNDPLIATWCRIMGKTPDSRLLIAAGGLQEPAIAQRIQQAFIAHGIPPRRLEFSGQLPLAQYLAAHQQIDILLDSFPVNGHTVTCHALWMGTPVVSLAGGSYRERLGASVLNNLGLPELLAETPERYVEIAAELAIDVSRLQSFRSTLRDRMKASPLLDARRFTRDVEAAYRTIWKRWCGS